LKVIVINGPNLNKLGERNASHYGTKTLDEINELLKTEAKKEKINIEFFFSNIEGEIITAIQNFDGDAIIINAGGYTHYSIAIRDALESKNCIKVEVHLSNILAREEFRSQSVLSSVCSGTITGFGYESYLLALDYISRHKGNTKK